MIIGCIIIAPTSHHPLSLTLLRHHRHPRHLHLPARWHHRHPVHHHRLAHLSLSSRSRTHLSVHHRLAHLLLISLSYTHLSARLRERLLLRRRRRIARLPLRRPHVALPSHHRRALLVSPRKALALPRTLLHRLSHKLALLPPLRRLLPQEPALFLPLRRSLTRIARPRLRRLGRGSLHGPRRRLLAQRVLQATRLQRHCVRKGQ